MYPILTNTAIALQNIFFTISILLNYSQHTHIEPTYYIV